MDNVATSGKTQRQPGIPQDNYRGKIEWLLSLADINIDGNRPWDFEVKDDRLYERLLAKGSLGLGEAYMDGWWECRQLDEFIRRLFQADLDKKIKTRTVFFDTLSARLRNLQKPSRAFQVGQRHYDIGNKLYEHMLDKRLIYSCGYWKDAATLDEAQEAKLDLVCRKLYLQPGMRLLDIGCGWGGTAKFIAENYKVEVVGITVSEEQANYAKELCRGLPVDIRLQDYRDLEIKFDRILSIGMFEHVGRKNYATYMRIVHDCLEEGGIFLLQTIGCNKTVSDTDPWFDRYIFPNYKLPSPKQISMATDGLFVIEDWQNFSTDYDKTLMQWFLRFDESWHVLKKDYNERFYRMWKYYLLTSAGAFRARVNQLWQIVFSPKGIDGGFQAPR